MRQVTMNKDELLGILKTNREDYQKDLTEAREAYRKLAVRALSERIESLSGASIDALPTVSFWLDDEALNPPKDHTKAYDIAIQMLEHEVNDTVMLSADEYQCMVQNDWSWTAGFQKMRSTYTKFLG